MFVAHPSFGAVKKKATPAPTATATVQVTPTATATPVTVTEKKARWIPWPPFPRDEARAIVYTVNSLYRDQGDGDYKGFSFFDLTAKRKIDEYAITGEGSVRFLSSASASDDAKQIQLRTAKADWAETWFSFTTGRFDITDQVSTTNFFGRYSFEGLHRVTGFRLYLPIRFLVGIEDYRSVSSPPTSLSFYYLPNIFQDIDADVSGKESFFLANARARFTIKRFQTVFLLNYGKSKSNYFQYSTINGSGTFSFSTQITFDNNYSIYGEFGIQNTSVTSGTEVAAIGASFKRLATFGPFSVDDIILEMQMPLSTSSENPFTGGNGIFTDYGITPRTAYYIKIKARARGVFLEADATTSVNDYTFARLNHSNINSLNFPLPVGGGLESEDTQFPFSSSDGITWGLMFSAGIKF